MKEIHRIPLDFPFLYYPRKFVHRLDNAIFNAKGNCGPAYEPTHYVLLLPYWVGILAAVYCIFCSLTGFNGGEVYAQITVVCCMPLLVIANLLLMSKHIMSIPDWPMRIFYALFVVVITVSCAFLSMYLSYILAMLFCCVVVVMMFFSGKGGNSSASGIFGPKLDYPNEIVINDGTFWGKSLHRDNDFDEWSDRAGEQYVETCTGFVKKY